MEWSIFPFGRNTDIEVHVAQWNLIMSEKKIILRWLISNRDHPGLISAA